MKKSKIITILITLCLSLIIVSKDSCATSKIYQSFNEIINSKWSETIVYAVVTDVRSYRSKDGKTIESEVTLNIKETIKGTHKDTLKVIIQGGTAEGFTLRVIGFPWYEPGDEIIACIVPKEWQGKGPSSVYYGEDGNFRVREGVVCRDNGKPIIGYDEEKGELIIQPKDEKVIPEKINKMTPRRFINLIKSILDKEPAKIGGN